jgi:membrane protein
MKERYSKLKNLFTQIFKSISEDNVALQGSSIAFYSIFSAAPLMYILITLAGALGNQQTIDVLTGYLNQVIGQDLAQPLIAIANAAHYQTTSTFVSILSIATLIFGATTAILQLRNAMNVIWGVEEPEINSILLIAIDRAISVIVVFVLMIILLGSMLLESRVRSFNSSTHSYLPHFFYSTLSFIPPLIFILLCILFFTVIFKLLPDISVRWRDIIVGACVTTALFFLGKYLIGIYLNNSSLKSTYKTAGSFIIFLIWIYYNAQIVLIGAEFTKVYTTIYGAGAQSAGSFQFFRKAE